MGKIKLEGAIDLHCHYGPDFIGRDHAINYAVTALQAATEAAQAGIAAIVLKSHDFPTPAVAYAVNQTVSGVQTFGGITLDYRWAVLTRWRSNTLCAWAPKSCGCRRSRTIRTT